MGVVEETLLCRHCGVRVRHDEESVSAWVHIGSPEMVWGWTLCRYFDGTLLDGHTMAEPTHWEVTPWRA